MPQNLCKGINVSYRIGKWSQNLYQQVTVFGQSLAYGHEIDAS